MEFYEHIDELDAYFADIRKIRTLTKEEEKELGKKIKKGDKKALHKLVKHNLRFVVNIAKYYRNRGVPFADLISEGNLGLYKAAEKYDGNKNVKLISYAISWIKCYILNCIKTYAVGVEDKFSDMEAYIDIQHQGEYINAEFEEKLVDIESRKNSIDELMKCLQERERKIITLFFGLNGNKEMTLEEVGKKTNLTMERVRQIKDKAMMKMKCSALSMDNGTFESFRCLC